MTSMKVSDICVCPVVHPNDILTVRCIGAKPKHKSCGGVIMNESRVLVDNRPKIEKR